MKKHKLTLRIKLGTYKEGRFEGLQYKNIRFTGRNITRKQFSKLRLILDKGKWVDYVQI